MTTHVEEEGTPWEIDDAEIVQRIMQTGVDAPDVNAPFDL
jgi:hypothetical protein